LLGGTLWLLRQRLLSHGEAISLTRDLLVIALAGFPPPATWGSHSIEQDCSIKRVNYQLAELWKSTVMFVFSQPSKAVCSHPFSLTHQGDVSIDVCSSDRTPFTSAR